MQRVTLPSGAWADLKHPTDVTERHRRPILKIRTQLAKHADFVDAIEKAQKKLDENKKLTKAEQDVIADGLGDSFDLLQELNDRVIVALVRAWSYEFPVDYDNVLDLPGKDLDELRQVTSPLMASMMPDFSPTKDRESPTGV